MVLVVFWQGGHQVQEGPSLFLTAILQYLGNNSDHFMAIMQVNLC